MNVATVSGGHALAAHYESLRQDVVEHSGRERTLQGRAVLMFKGMAVWMRCMGEAALNSTNSTLATPYSESRLPAGMEQNLINIVAAMALATTRENLP